MYRQQDYTVKLNKFHHRFILSGRTGVVLPRLLKMKNRFNFKNETWTSWSFQDQISSFTLSNRGPNIIDISIENYFD